EHPLPIGINPRVVFEPLFGGGTSKARRAVHLRADRSILDSIKEDESRLARTLGAGDRTRLTDYLDTIREIERRLQAAEKQAMTSVTQPDIPIGVPDLYDHHVSLLLDLMTVTYQADITRVATLMLGRELTNRTYPQAGVPESHHAVSHHQNNAATIDKHAKINTYHMSLLARFLARLEETPDGSGSLLDHSIIVYGSGMANGNVHSHDPLWLLLAGRREGGAGR